MSHLDGENNSHWKGGTYMSHDGYKMVKTSSGKRKIGWTSYEKEHRVVMMEFLQRTLVKGETVHHIDGNKLNNDIENLFLLDSENNHRQVHNSLQEVGYFLYKLGLIEFDRETKRYVANIKLCELLGQLEEANQQPSLNGNVLEGSTTRDESQADNNFSTSAGHQIGDDIV